MTAIYHFDEHLSVFAQQTVRKSPPRLNFSSEYILIGKKTQSQFYTLTLILKAEVLEGERGFPYSTSSQRVSLTPSSTQPINRKNISQHMSERTRNRFHIQPIIICRRRSIMITCLFLVSKMKPYFDNLGITQSFHDYVNGHAGTAICKVGTRPTMVLSSNVRFTKNGQRTFIRRYSQFLHCFV